MAHEKQSSNVLVDSIDVFPWNEHFNTGIPIIDEQHQRLVMLINRLASHIALGSDDKELNLLFQELFDYSVYHFQTEEAIWHEYLTRDSLEIEHKEEHSNFIATVLNLKAKENTHPSSASEGNTIEEVLSFLISWLAFHILKKDKYMALVVQAIQSGMPHEQAKIQAKKQLHSGMEALINIMLLTYGNLATNAMQLMKEVVERKRAEQNLRLIAEHLDQANQYLEKQYTDFISVLSRIIEMRPGIKCGQSKYIAGKALLVARNLGMAPEKVKDIFYAGLLIQIGKMSLPDTLLSIPFDVLPFVSKKKHLKHSVEGEALLKGLTKLNGASVLIRHQYENYDGSGTPDGLAQQEIPLGSRILSVVRDYITYLDTSKTKDAIDFNNAIKKLKAGQGSLYDPDVVNAFLDVIKEEIDIVDNLPILNKSWKRSQLWDTSESRSLASLVIDIPLNKLKLGMKIESVYFDNKPYIKNCIVDEKILKNIMSLTENTGTEPLIKVIF